MRTTRATPKNQNPKFLCWMAKWFLMRFYIQNCYVSTTYSGVFVRIFMFLIIYFKVLATILL